MAAGAGLAAGVYGAYVAVTWFRYGRVGRSTTGESDQLIDRFMPAYEVVDRHQIRVHAPAAATLATAREVELFQLPLVRAIVRGRELILGAPSDDRLRPRGLLAEMQALGWVVLAERPEREIVVGAVTRPWEPQVTFRSLPPEAFAAFDEPDYVKIVWTLRTDPVGDDRTIFTTETRVVATDSKARATFRRYWAVFSPGITLIRQLALRQVKAAAEQRGRRIRRPARHPA